MAMNGNTLGTAIYNYIIGLDDSQQSDTQAVWQGISNIIVSHIQTNAVISVANVTAVQPGAGVSGPGTGTIS